MNTLAAVVSWCLFRKQLRGLALPVEFQDNEVLPCGGVSLSQGLYRSAFTLTVNHKSHLIDGPMVWFTQWRILESDTGSVPRGSAHFC